MTVFPARVASVSPKSLASRCGLRAGDLLLTINDHPLRDVIDVQLYSGEAELRLLYEREGDERTCKKRRRYGEPLGLDFETALFDGPTRVCQNNCDFCFVSQMAPGLRGPLYVKDDDYRLSFLHGNYVTLTNVREEDWTRIEEQFLSPLYVSVHVTDPATRVALMRNPRAATIMADLVRLKEMGITMHTQAVLVPGRNDGPFLESTIEDLSGLYPAVMDLSVVPVGLTKWHSPKVRPYTQAEASMVLEKLMRWQADFRTRLGISFVYPADEWFLRAGMSPPGIETYDGQLPVLAENGVGMVRRFMDNTGSLREALKRLEGLSQTWVTGTLFAPVLSAFARTFTLETGIEVNVVPVSNRAFGRTVTVAGLLTVGDMVKALEATALGEILILPDEIFRGPGGTSLDDRLPSEIARFFGRSVVLAGYENDAWVLRPAA